MQSVPPLSVRLRAAATVLGTFAVTLALLGGMPYVLWRATGLPWPEHVPSPEELVRRLAQPVSDPLVIDLLAMAGWVSWGAFAGTVVREVCWYTVHLPQLLRDRRAHEDHMVLLSRRGTLAALCVGTLVVALISLWYPETDRAEASSGLGDQRARIAAMAPLVPSPAWRSFSPAMVAAADARDVRAHPAAQHLGAAGQTGGGRHVDYTVVEGDTLWDIAQAHMGDALKWPRIYALNKDRVQDDGGQLNDPDLIEPGWRLTVPVHQGFALTRPSAPGRDAAPTPRPEAPQERTGRAHPPASADNSTGHQRHRSDPSTPPPQHSNAIAEQGPDTKSRPAAVGLGQAGLIGITAAAGLLAARRYWYVHRRRCETDAEGRLLALSPLVDKAAQAALAADVPRRRIDTEPLVAHQPAPQKPRDPGTVTIGVRNDVEVTFDELGMTGGVAWTGPGAMGAARALLLGILAAAERQRPGPPHTKAVMTRTMAERLLQELPTPFTALTQLADTAEVVRAAEHHRIAHARERIESITTENADRTTATRPVQDGCPGTLLLLVEPAAAHNGQLQALTAHIRAGELVVLILNGSLPGATSWHIAKDGTVTYPATDHSGSEPLRLFQITPEAGLEMTDVLLAAHGQSPSPSPPPAPVPASSRGEASKATTNGASIHRPDAKPSPVSQNKPVRLHVLGPITIYARGHQEPIGTNLRDEVREFLALLAAHPAGLLAHDIAEKLELDLIKEPNGLKNLRRAVRRALRAATGITGQEFVLLHGELHKLHPDLVETDLGDLSHALRTTSSTLGEKENQHSALAAAQGALAHYRGPFAQGSEYPWVETLREHFATQAVDSVLRLARRAEHGDIPVDEQGATLALLERVGAIHPDHERLVQHTIRLYQAAGRHDAAQHAYARLERHLAQLDIEPEPATRALLKSRQGVRHAAP